MVTVYATRLNMVIDTRKSDRVFYDGKTCGGRGIFLYRVFADKDDKRCDWFWGSPSTFLWSGSRQRLTLFCMPLLTTTEKIRIIV